MTPARQGGEVIEGNKRFGTYLRALREARRLTLEDVERLTLQEIEPVSRSLLSRLENGKARISALKLMALSRLYRVRLGMLAERMEIDHEMDRLEQEHIERWSIEEVLAQARQAGLSGHIHRALLLYEHAEVRTLEGGEDPRLRVRTRLGVARALAAAGRYRTARTVLDDVLSEELEAAERVWAFYLLARVSLNLNQGLLARAALLSLRQLPPPWPPEIETAAQALEGDFQFFEGKLESARETWLAALDTARKHGEHPLEVQGMIRMGALERQMGRTNQALEWIQKAGQAAQTHGAVQLGVQALTEEGRIHLARRRPDLARQAWSQARAKARKLDLHLELFDIYLELWRLAERTPDPSESRAALRSLRHLARFLEAIPDHARDVLPHLHAAPLPLGMAARKEVH